MTRLLGTLTVLTLFLAACGSDEDDFRDQLKEFDSSITDDTVDCIIAELDARGLSVVDISDEAVGDGPIPAGGPEAFLACLPVDSSGSAD